MMAPKRYQLHVGKKKFDYTYDAETGVIRIRLPGSTEFITTRSPNADEARADVRGLIEAATGETVEYAPERREFLSDVLCTLAEKGLDFGGGYVVRTTRENGEYRIVTVQYPGCGEHLHPITLDSIASALANVNNAVNPDQLAKLDISESWRKKMAHANSTNDAGMIDPHDAADLAEISVFGRVVY